MRGRAKRSASAGVDQLVKDEEFDGQSACSAGSGGAKKKRRLSEEARQRHRECNRLVAQRARARIKQDLGQLRTENGVLEVEITLLRQVKMHAFRFHFRIFRNTFQRFQCPLPLFQGVGGPAPATCRLH